MIPNTTKRNQKFLAMRISYICKIIESFRYRKPFCQCISPDPSIGCRTFPACKNVCEEHGKVTYEETVLRKKAFSIPIETLENGRWREGHMATINGSKASSEERP
jgi:hypothetical protein